MWFAPQANNTARDLQKRVEQLDRLSLDLKSKLDETTIAYETTLRDLRNKQTELQRVNHELDKTRDQKEALARENKKITGEINNLKGKEKSKIGLKLLCEIVCK